MDTQGCRGGDAEAQTTLATCYLSGDGVPKNMDEAIKWLQRAAKQGDKDALGILRKLKKSTLD